MNCKRGKYDSVDYNRVLALFTKYYNNWYIVEEEKVKCNNGIEPKNVIILARIVSYFGRVFKEIHPEIYGRRNPGSVYLVKYIKDVLAVKGKLEDGLLGRE